MKTKLFFDTQDSNHEGVFNRISEQFSSKQIGYYSLPFDQASELQEIQKAASGQDLRNVVVVGIGGSSLGAKAIDRLLRHTKSSKTELLFLENADPIELTCVVGGLDLEKTRFVITSKSGSTIETTSIFKYIISLYGGLENARSKLFVITDKSSALDKFASSNGIKSFWIYPNVGGRFSVLSAVGLLPLALAGYDVGALLEGAAKLGKNFFDGNDEHNLLQKAHFMANAKERVSVLFAYANEFEEFVKWFVQLWAESLGKIDEGGKNVGLTPIGIIGSVDQHSFLQLIMEGPKDKTVTFIKIADFENDAKIPDIELEFLEKTNFVNGKKFSELINAQCDATLEALLSVGITTDLIELEKIDAFNVGYLIYYYELLTSIAGENMHVNTYNQPGVELGKKLLEKRFK